jgi:nitrite reductase (NADH) small subunit
MTWTSVCAVDALAADRGAAALVDGHQVAIFRLATGEIYAVDHRDPFSGANVMARGLVGTRGDIPTVASPIYKQVFDLQTGKCLDDDSVALRSWPVRVVDGMIEVDDTVSDETVSEDLVAHGEGGGT